MCLCVGMCVFVCLSINMTMWVGVYKLHEKKVMFGQVRGHSRHYEGFFIVIDRFCVFMVIFA